MPPRLRTLLAVTAPLLLRSVVPLVLLLLLLAPGLPARAGSVAIINGSSCTPCLTSTITANLDDLLQEAGNTTTIFVSVPADLSPFDQLWDIRYNDPISAAEQTQYLDFLTAGGGMFVMGENSGFMHRNNPVLNLIAAAGGGSLTFDGQLSSTQDVVPPFDGPNLIPDGTVTYAAPGGVTSAGGGQFITVDGPDLGAGVAFGEGQLVNAPSGVLTTIFDVNFMEGTRDQPSSQQLLRNLISFIASAALTPELALNPVGTEHTLTATLRGADGEPLVGTNVTFSVISGPNADDQGTDTTDENGEAQFTYLGDGGYGVDEIVATFMDENEEIVESNVALKFWDDDRNENGIPDTCDLSCDGFEGQCNAFAGCGELVGEVIILSPAEADRDVGTEHTATALVHDGFGEPAEGVEVHFEVLSGPNAGETGDDTTDQNGEATFTYTGDGEWCGSDEIIATATVGGGELESNEATVQWLVGEGIILRPARAHLNPGEEHTATALVYDDYCQPMAGVVVTLAVSEGHNEGQTSDDTTDEGGEATFTYTGDGEPGWGKIVATAEGGELESNEALVLWGSGARQFSDWAEAFDYWTYEDAVGEEHTIGFLAARNAGVHVLDVTNPLDAQSLGSYQPGLCETDGATTDFYADDVTFVEAQEAIHIAAGACGVHIVNVANARNPDDSNRPVPPGSWEPQPPQVYDRHVKYSSAWVEAVAIDAGIAYVADYDALRIFDVSNLDDIQERGSIDSTNPDFDGGPVGNVAIYYDDDNEQLLAMVATGDGMRVVNVQDPEVPYVIGTYQHPEHPTDPDLNPISQDIAVDPQRRTVLIPAWVGGFSVVDISDMPAPEFPPPPPHEFGLLDTLSTLVAYYTAVPYEGRIYATEGIEGLRVLDLVDGELEASEVPPDPIEVGSPGEDWAWDVVVANCVAYVTFGNLVTSAGGLQLTPLPLEACEDSNAVEPQGVQTDNDLDGVADAEDNCLDLPNADQTDSDLDGFGNACDADYDGGGLVGIGDFIIFSAAYGASASDDHYDARADHNEDGIIGVPDFLVFSHLWGNPPGPSGLACAGSVPCP